MPSSVISVSNFPWKKVERHDERHATTALTQADVFAVRSMDEETIGFCMDDILVLPHLYSRYQYRLKQYGDRRTRKVGDQTMLRISEAKLDDYRPFGQHKTISLWGACLDPPKYRYQVSKES
ncbi:hypothetical protein E2P81_ATG01573 [Venturia nashicola]|nr:hypothetical protein E2P81_ATG01573 [Venturia nashicola]